MLGSVALLDSCVLYPAPLRDFLLRLGTANLYQPRWSPQIHEEWINNLLADRADLTRDRLVRTRDLMDAALPQAMVTGYDALMDVIDLPDPDDRHVAAAAVQGKATALITFNLRHFPAAALSAWGVTALSPDAFALALYNEAPNDMIAVIRNHRAQLTRPSKTADEYIATLIQNHLTQTADVVSRHRNEI